MPSHLQPVRQRWSESLKPTNSGLPNRRVVVVPLAILGLLLVALVGLGVTGSSTGYLNQFVNSRSDPNLIAGEPQAIRSDEWYVQSSWTVSQFEQGLPIRNEAFPGGMDATVQHDLPSTDWSMAFRPHLLGFLFLPLDNAMALKWWLPAFAMVAGVYLFGVSLLPRRPIAVAATAVGFAFAPFFQWWFLSITFWPAAWAFFLMASVVWLLKTDRTGPRIWLPLVVGYLAVTVGTGIYVPFIVAATLVALAFSVGFVLTQSSSPIVGVWRRLKRLGPIFAAGIGAGVVLVVWAATRWETITGFSSTVYPGERLQPVGAASAHEMLSFFGGTFSNGFTGVSANQFGSNASEAASFLLPGVFLAIPFLWMLWSQVRKRSAVDWTAVALLACGALLVAYLLVPGWDAIAHLLLLDRTTTGRIRLAAGMLSVVMTVVMLARVDAARGESVERPRLVPRPVVWATVALAFVTFAVVAVYLYRNQSSLVTGTWIWVAVTLAVLVVVWASTVGRAGAAGIAFLIASLLVGGGVNPVYAGVYDLNGTSLVKELKRIDTADPGQWVGVGSTVVPTVLLVQSGLPSFNGFQSTPSQEMWAQIDPDGTSEQIWNRLANVTWLAGEGGPAPMNPAPDQIRMTFDSCDAFAQQNVRHVLSTEPLAQPCLGEPRTIRQGPGSFYVYEVLPRG